MEAPNTFREDPTDDGYVGEGRFCTPRNDVDFILMKNDRPNQKEKSPTHLVYGKAHRGGLYQVGAAWAYEIKKGETKGRFIYRVVFDKETHGSFPPFPLKIFPRSDDPALFDVKRELEQEPQQQAEAA